MQQEVQQLFQEKYNNKPTKRFYKDIKRLKEGEPLDYIIGFRKFLGCKIDLSKKPLIPRTETEFWVGKTLKKINHNFSDRVKYDVRVLDIFAGSGCIGIAVLKNIKNSKVVFADKDKKCLVQIKINLKLNKLATPSFIRANIIRGENKRYAVVESDVFNNIKARLASYPGFSEARFDYIFANPPYIAKRKINQVQKSVLKFEPKQALFGGTDGLIYIKKFLKKAKDYLNWGGKVFMEFSPEQKNKIDQLLKKNGYKKWQFHKDQYGKWRWVLIKYN